MPPPLLAQRPCALPPLTRALQGSVPCMHVPHARGDHRAAAPCRRRRCRRLQRHSPLAPPICCSPTRRGAGPASAHGTSTGIAKVGGVWRRSPPWFLALGAARVLLSCCVPRRACLHQGARAGDAKHFFTVCLTTVMQTYTHMRPLCSASARAIACCNAAARFYFLRPVHRGRRVRGMRRHTAQSPSFG